MEVFDWLFGTREGVMALLGIALLGFLVAAVVLERRTRSQFDRYEDDDSEDGWSIFDDDNK